MESVKGIDFLYNCVHLLYYKCHKTNPNCGGSYIDSPDWIKDKKSTINTINKKDKKLFSIRCNSRIKSRTNKKRSEKN